VIVEVDNDGPSAGLRRWMRKGQVERLAGGRCDLVTVALSACRSSAASLKPCALGHTARLAARLRAAGAHVNDSAVYVDVGVDTDVEERLREYTHALAVECSGASDPAAPPCRDETPCARAWPRSMPVLSSAAIAIVFVGLAMLRLRR
jgi:hypothetical protein